MHVCKMGTRPMYCFDSLLPCSFRQKGGAINSRMERAYGSVRALTACLTDG